MDKVPEDSVARVAFLERWAIEQERRVYASEIARVVAQGRQRTRKLDSRGGVAVVPVVITKPSDPAIDRAAVFADLIAGLREYEWADPIVSECDEPRYIAPKAIDLARSHRPGAPWLLYMEDDVILGPDFGWLPEILREADELFPYTGVASFFSGSVEEPGWSIRSMEEFGWLQCAAIRNTEQLVGFRAFIDYLPTQSAGNYEFPDMAVRAFLATEYGAYAVWCPSLVQHAEVTSAFFGENKRASKRISKSYERAYR